MQYGTIQQENLGVKLGTYLRPVPFCNLGEVLEAAVIIHTSASKDSTFVDNILLVVVSSGTFSLSKGFTRQGVIIKPERSLGIVEIRFI